MTDERYYITSADHAHTVVQGVDISRPLGRRSAEHNRQDPHASRSVPPIRLGPMPLLPHETLPGFSRSPRLLFDNHPPPRIDPNGGLMQPQRTGSAGRQARDDSGRTDGPSQGILRQTGQLQRPQGPHGSDSNGPGGHASIDGMSSMRSAHELPQQSWPAGRRQDADMPPPTGMFNLSGRWLDAARPAGFGWGPQTLANGLQDPGAQPLPTHIPPGAQAFSAGPWGADPNSGTAPPGPHNEAIGSTQGTTNHQRNWWGKPADIHNVQNPWQATGKSEFPTLDGLPAGFLDGVDEKRGADTATFSESLSSAVANGEASLRPRPAHSGDYPHTHPGGMHMGHSSATSTAFSRPHPPGLSPKAPNPLEALLDAAAPTGGPHPPGFPHSHPVLARPRSSQDVSSSQPVDRRAYPPGFAPPPSMPGHSHSSQDANPSQPADRMIHLPGFPPHSDDRLPGQLRPTLPPQQGGPHQAGNADYPFLQPGLQHPQIHTQQEFASQSEQQQLGRGLAGGPPHSMQPHSVDPLQSILQAAAGIGGQQGRHGGHGPQQQGPTHLGHPQNPHPTQAPHLPHFARDHPLGQQNRSEVPAVPSLHPGDSHLGSQPSLPQGLPEGLHFHHASPHAPWLSHRQHSQQQHEPELPALGPHDSTSLPPLDIWSSMQQWHGHPYPSPNQLGGDDRRNDNAANHAPLPDAQQQSHQQPLPNHHSRDSQVQRYLHGAHSDPHLAPPFHGQPQIQPPMPSGVQGQQLQQQLPPNLAGLPPHQPHPPSQPGGPLQGVSGFSGAMLLAMLQSGAGSTAVPNSTHSQPPSTHSHPHNSHGNDGQAGHVSMQIGRPPAPGFASGHPPGFSHAEHAGIPGVGGNPAGQPSDNMSHHDSSLSHGRWGDRKGGLLPPSAQQHLYGPPAAAQATHSLPHPQQAFNSMQPHPHGGGLSSLHLEGFPHGPMLDDEARHSNSSHVMGDASLGMSQWAPTPSPPHHPDDSLACGLSRGLQAATGSVEGGSPTSARSAAGSHTSSRDNSRRSSRDTMRRAGHDQSQRGGRNAVQHDTGSQTQAHTQQLRNQVLSSGLANSTSSGARPAARLQAGQAASTAASAVRSAHGGSMQGTSKVLPIPAAATGSAKDVRTSFNPAQPQSRDRAASQVHGKQAQQTKQQLQKGPQQPNRKSNMKGPDPGSPAKRTPRLLSRNAAS